MRRAPLVLFHYIMRGLTSSLAVKAVFIVLFLWIQGVALYDAAAHGEQPHDHYGVSCELTTAVHAEVAPLPAAPPLPKPPRAILAGELPTLDFRPWSQPPGRAPPPRSPPALHQ